MRFSNSNVYEALGLLAENFISGPVIERRLGGTQSRAQHKPNDASADTQLSAQQHPGR